MEAGQRAAEDIKLNGIVTKQYKLFVDDFSQADIKRIQKCMLVLGISTTLDHKTVALAEEAYALTKIPQRGGLIIVDPASAILFETNL